MTVSRFSVPEQLALPGDANARPAPRLRDRYRRVFIVDGRRTFATVRAEYDVTSDLVLTYDFGLKRELERLGGDVCYVDQLIDTATMQEDNHRLYQFFTRWNLDQDGTDIFTHDGVPFGFSFRLEFWNDFIFYARTRLCLERIAGVAFESLRVGTERGEIESVLREMGLVFVPIASEAPRPDVAEYFFPIHRWMEANIRRRGLKARLVNAFSWIMARVLAAVDAVSGLRSDRPAVFVQEYYPTAGVIGRLRADGRVRVVSPAPSRAHLFTRYLPLPSRSVRHQRAAERLLASFRSRRSARIVTGGGVEITESVYRLIESRIASRVAESIRVVEGTCRHLARDPFRLVLLIANIGEIVTVVDCVCRARCIPSFLIINGMLAAEFGDDSKHATTINAYSSSIREHYFRGMPNVVTLGDPRMDAYPAVPRKVLQTNRFTLTIGASGFNPTDLNSYIAVEFDFMYGVLEAVRRLQQRGRAVTVMIKVRANGSKAQYESFVAEYFADLSTELIDDAPMRAVLDATDLFVSIYSQTLFEASCMGIPVIYYRVGDVYKYPPFDGHSEVVTVDTPEMLEVAIDDFLDGNSRFDAFLDRSVMEKYIGPLDGRCLERNLKQVYDMVAMPSASLTR